MRYNAYARPMPMCIVYIISLRRRQMPMAVRQKVAGLINAPSPNEGDLHLWCDYEFELNCSLLGRLLICKSGDEILITIAEHHANIIPWQMIAQRTGAKIIACPPRE